VTASNGGGASQHLEPPHLRREVSEVTELKTRVSELEVINDLFRGRVAELERSEQEARALQSQAEAEADRARKAEHTIATAFSDAKRRIEMLETELASGEHRSKRLRVEDFVRDDAEVSELSTPSQAAL
jgi:GATA-binding protein, other eukaryote